MKFIFFALLLFSLFNLSHSACTVNADCPVQGECCSSIYDVCGTYSSCVTSDGLKGRGVSCSTNAECATGCCSYFWDYCTASTYYCMDNPQGLTGKGIFVIILAVIATVAIVLLFCIGCYKLKKEK